MKRFCLALVALLLVVGSVAVFAQGSGIRSTALQNPDGTQITFPAAACDDPAKVTSVSINTASSGNTELVALTSNQIIYVCGFSFNTSGTVSVKFLYGTGSACGTGGTDLMGAQDYQAREGSNMPSGGAVQLKGAVSNAFCINLSAAVGVHGFLTYVKQ